MKKYILICLCMLLVFCFAGCGEDEHQSEIDALNEQLMKYEKYKALTDALDAADYDTAAEILEAMRLQAHGQAVADGAVQEIPITMDNWSQYFELREITHWQQNGMGQNVGFITHVCVTLRDEYADAVVSDKSRVEFAWQALCSVKNVSVDLESKLIHMENVFQSKVTTFGAPETMSGTITYGGTAVEQNWDENAYVAAEIGEILLVGEYMLNGATKSVCYDYDDTTITAVQGLLTLKPMEE